MSTVIDLHGRQLPEAGRLHARRDPLPDRPGRGAQGGEEGGPGGAEARRQGDRADLREGLDPDALRVRGRRLRPGRSRDVHRAVGLAHGPQGDREGHCTRARAHVRRDRVPRLRPGRRRGTGGVVRRARLQRPHRRVAPDADARRLPDLHRARGQAVRGDRLLLPRRRPLQHGRQLPRRRSQARLRRPHREPEVALAAGRDRLARQRDGGRDGREDHDHRGRRGSREGRRLPAHRRVGVDGRAGGRLEAADRPAAALPGQLRDDGADGQPGRQVHALPAGLPQHGHAGGQGDLRQVRPRRSRGDGGGVRVRRVDRLRRGREPAAHDQGGDGRDARELRDARRRRARRQRPAPARRAADGGEPAGERAGAPARRSRPWRASTSS